MQIHYMPHGDDLAAQHSSLLVAYCQTEKKSKQTHTQKVKVPYSVLF